MFDFNKLWTIIDVSGMRTEKDFEEWAAKKNKLLMYKNFGDSWHPIAMQMLKINRIKRRRYECETPYRTQVKNVTS